MLVLSVGCTGIVAADYPPRDAVECRPRGGLPNLFSKVDKGATVRIAYLGGSITAQAGWRPKSLDWFRHQFPAARFEEINAAIGGTGSDLGVFRLQNDVLQHQPDLLFVEFAVNDSAAAPERIHQTMEGIVRQTWRQEPHTDICFVYTLKKDMLADLQAGRLPRSAAAMEALADHYAIPSIHLGIEVARLEAEGRLVFAAPQPKTAAEKEALGDRILFSPDGVHPYTDSGHDLYLQAIVRSIPVIRAAEFPAAHAVLAPMTADNWEDARMLPLDHAVLGTGWTRLSEEENALARRFGMRLPGLWHAAEPGTVLKLRFRGKGLRIYDLLGPDCGQLSVQVDEQEPRITPRFDAYCTYHRLSTLGIAVPDDGDVHTVTLAVHPEPPDKAAILSQRNQKIDDPERFNGTNWYAGAILLRGEILNWQP